MVIRSRRHERNALANMSTRNGADGRCLIVPSDLLVREFDAKLLFACAAAERGFSAIVGSKFDTYRMMEAWPRGFYVHKDVHSRPGLLQRLRRLGHHVLAWDEEGLVNVSPERYLQMRVSGQVLGLAEALFAWGEENAEAWRHFGGYAGTPIHVTGNPRGDLMRPELRGYFDEEVEALRARLGRFVLLNTNFGFVNNFVTKSTRGFGVEWRREAAGVDGFMDGFIGFRGEIFRHFLAMVPRLAEGIAGTTLVIRPHPTEDHEAWRRAADGRPNVHVVHEGNVTPWLLAAAVTVHNGCSTGLEAHLLGRPAISYCPLKSERYDIPLPNAVSHEAATVDDLIDAVRAALDGSLAVDGVEAERRRQIVAHNIVGMEQTLASDRIVDVVERFAGGSARLGAWRQVQRWLDSTFSSRRADKDETAKEAIKKQRFPDTPLEAVRARIARLRRSLDRFHDVDAAQLTPNVFHVAHRGES
jgi:surface carbohydrate biosynthesis protein